MSRELGNSGRPLGSLVPRPIHPADPKPADHIVSNLDSSPQQSTDSGSLPSKKKAVPAACQECRKKKVKCTAERPSCNICLVKQIQCVYDTAELETPRQALKRKYDDLQLSKSAYEKIFHLLRTRPEAEATTIFQQIRQGIDARTLLGYIEHRDILQGLSQQPEKRSQYEASLTQLPEYLRIPRNLYLESLIYEWTLKENRSDDVHTSTSRNGAIAEFYGPYLSPYNTADIVDVQLDGVEPSKWTSVTTNDELMRVLLRVYFKYEYGWSPFFQKDLFLRDMSKGHQNFCSSLLVNAVLALACHCYRDLSDRAEFWNPHTLGHKFFAEAKRLWELENPTPRLTTIQTGPIMNTLHIVHGTDNLGWLYTMKSIALARDLGLFNASNTIRDMKIRIGREFTAWALFRWQSTTCYLFLRPPLLSEPPEFSLPVLAEKPQWYGEIWVKYPEIVTLCPVHFGEQLQAITQFAVILNAVSRVFFAPKRDGHQQISYPDHILNAYSKLQSWYENLPEPLTARNIIFPSHLKLHIQYHHVTIQLFESLLQAQQEQPGIGDICESVSGKRPETIIQDARTHVETLLWVYYLRHGFEELDIFLQAPLTLIGFISLDTVHQSVSVQHDHAQYERLSSVVLCAKGLSEQAHSQFTAGVLFWLFRNHMVPEDVNLVDKFIKVNQVEAAVEPRLSSVQSSLPVNVTRITDNPEGRRLSNLLEQYLPSTSHSEAMNETE